MKVILGVVLGLVPAIVAAQAPLPSERFVPAGYVSVPNFFAPNSPPFTSYDVTAAGQVVTRDYSFIQLLNDAGASLNPASNIPCASESQAILELAVDGGGRIVAQCGNGGALQRFTVAGALFDTLAVGGNGTGQVSQVSEISVLADGTIVVSDDGRDRVLLFNGNTGAFIREFGPVSGLGPGFGDGRLRALPDNSGGLIVLRADGTGTTLRAQQWTVEGTLVANYQAPFTPRAAPPAGYLDDGATSATYVQAALASTRGRLFAFGANASAEVSGQGISNPGIDVLTALPLPSGPVVPSVGRARLPVGSGQWVFPRDVLVMPSGDLLVATTGPGAILRMQRTRRVQTPASGGIAVPTLVQVAPRTGSTIVDLRYRVDDSNSATVAAYVVAFRNASITPSTFVRLSTLVEGTAANQGNAQPTNTTRLLSWDAAADLGVGTGFANVAFDVLARETGALLDFRFVTIPPNVPTSGTPAALEISATPVFDGELVAVWQWLLASNDAEVALDAGALERVSDGAVLVAADGTISATGRTYLLSRAGVRQATLAEADRARTGASPGEQRYGRTHQIAWAPVSNNEIGVDLQCHLASPTQYNCADRRNAGYLVVPL
jgi:hypothetical protein